MSSIARLVALLDGNGFDVVSLQSDGRMLDETRYGIGLTVRDRWVNGEQDNGTKDEGNGS